MDYSKVEYKTVVAEVLHGTPSTRWISNNSQLDG
jgi:hypothetical protein